MLIEIFSYSAYKWKTVIKEDNAYFFDKIEIHSKLRSCKNYLLFYLLETIKSWFFEFLM